MILRALLAAGALTLAAPGPARAGEGAPGKVRVALDPLRAAGVPAAYARAVEERVCVALGARPDLEVICPADVAAAALLARNAMLFGECQADDCLKRVEAVKAADERITGAVEQGERGVVISLERTRPDGPGPRVVEKLPGDLEAALTRIPALVKRLFP